MKYTINRTDISDEDLHIKTKELLEKLKTKKKYIFMEDLEDYNLCVKPLTGVLEKHQKTRLSAVISKQSKS